MKAKPSKQQGFTLVELLVVIVIIGILASLITVAVTAALGAAKRTRILAEINQLTTEIERYKVEFGSYPPSTSLQLKAHVRDKFPRADARDINTIPDNLTPAEILWFCVRGYTSDPQRPVDFFNVTAKRSGNLVFDQGRLVQTRRWDHNPNTMGQLQSPRTQQQFVYAYVPQEGKGAPYVYFDCYKPFDATRFSQGPNSINDAARPYLTITNDPDPNKQVKRANDGKFQIISAGLDGLYGDQIANPSDLKSHKFFPDGINYTEGDKDNLVNFSERSLEDAKP
ncbi:MAG: prepilin-type N-terminal cleavage/methylation domain-containing protein [Pirellulales bacterium]